MCVHVSQLIYFFQTHAGPHRSSNGNPTGSSKHSLPESHRTEDKQSADYSGAVLLAHHQEWWTCDEGAV